MKKTYFFKTSGETPSKKNSRVVNTKTGRSFPNKRFTLWHSAALGEIIGQKGKYSEFHLLDDPQELTLVFIHGDKRRRDSDNGTNSILDLLTDAGVIADDNYNIIQKINVYNLYEKGAAACYIIIEPLKTVIDFKGMRAAVDDFINK